MIKNEEQMESKKEYTTPQMEVMSMEVMQFLCDSGPESIDLECEGSNCP